MVNATGWNELIEGKMVEAAYTMFDSSFNNLGIIIVILFFVTQFLLYSKTKNATLMLVLGVLFASLYAVSDFVTPFARNFIFILLAIEGGAVFVSFLLSKRQMEG